jgi:Cu/Ag efflux protein CusF
MLSTMTTTRPLANFTTGTMTDNSAALQSALRVCRDAAQGNLESRILNIDDEHPWAELLHSINHLLDMTDGFVREAVASLQHAGRDQYYRRVLQDGMRGTFAKAAEQINTSVASMEEKNTALREAETRRSALANEFQSANQVVDDLDYATKEIGNISEVIRKIASQSNLLAINAMIETARVGERGTGFGVVATEVRRLSESTAAATREIARKVEAIQESSGKVTHVIQQIQQTLLTTTT